MGPVGLDGSVGSLGCGISLFMNPDVGAPDCPIP